MRQRRICEYLGLTCTHLRSFLCLLPAVRHRIYYEAGLVNDTDVDLNRRPDAADSWPSSADFQFSYNLLLTCRAVHAEVSSILYSTNRFFIRYRDSQNLRALRNLRAQSLSSLTYLTIHLNIASCEKDQPCYKAYPENPRSRRLHDKPLTTSLRKHQAILFEWQSVAGHLTTHIKPLHLQLHFICDVEDFEAAMRAVKPLHNTPILADCSIRLGQQFDHTLQDLAYQTVTRAVGYRCDRPKSPFRFLDLPRELRRKILEYTISSLLSAK